MITALVVLLAMIAVLSVAVAVFLRDLPQYLDTGRYNKSPESRIRSTFGFIGALLLFVIIETVYFFTKDRQYD
jgi:hypothetical protein